MELFVETENTVKLIQDSSGGLPNFSINER